MTLLHLETISKRYGPVAAGTAAPDLGPLDRVIDGRDHRPREISPTVSCIRELKLERGLVLPMRAVHCER